MKTVLKETLALLSMLGALATMYLIAFALGAW